MGGTLLNVVTVLVGSSVGLLIGHRLSSRMQESVMMALGLVTIAVGVSNAGTTGNIIIPLLSLVVGVIIGEVMGLDRQLDRFAGWLQARVQGSPPAPEAPVVEPVDHPPQDQRARFIQGFVTASLLFCVGPLAFIGSIQDGMGLDSGFEQLAIKSLLDLFAAMAFASTLGIGVMFSVLSVFGVQGSLALVGSLAGEFMTDAMVNEMTAVGGLMLIGVALSLMDIKKPRMVNFLPALLIAPALVLVAGALGIDIYPL